MLPASIPGQGTRSHRLQLDNPDATPRQHIKKQRCYFASKGPSSQSYGFSSSHMWMWELDCKESWALKNWCFWTFLLEKALESPLDSKEIQPVHSKGNQSVLNILWKDWCWSWTYNTLAMWCEEWTHLKRPDAGKDWRWEEKGMTEGEMVEWHHWLNGHEFESTLEVDDGQRDLACCSLWGRQESDTTEQLNWTELIQPYYYYFPSIGL